MRRASEFLIVVLVLLIFVGEAGAQQKSSDDNLANTSWRLVNFGPVGSETSEEDLTTPVGLLASYYRAINSKDCERAYRYWERRRVRCETS